MKTKIFAAVKPEKGRQENNSAAKTKRGVVAVIFSERGLQSEGAQGAEHEPDALHSQHAGRNPQRVFLLLHRCLNWRGWEFVKGGVEENENSEDAVKREIFEETGLDEVSVLKKIPGKNTWSAKGVEYIYETFLVRVQFTADIKLAKGIKEHDSCKWCSADEALALLTHGNNKESLRKALENLK